MRKIILPFTLGLLVVLLVSGGSSDIREQENNILESSSETVHPINTQAPKVEDVAWKEAYATFLMDLPIDSDYSNAQFSLWDLDNNGVPELIIVQPIQPNKIGGVLTIYSYNGNVYKIGESTNGLISARDFRFSINQEFPGLFTLFLTRGGERHVYLTIEEDALKVISLWDINYSKDTPDSYEMRRNKKLIEESINVNEVKDSILTMYLITEDNILEMSR